MSIKAETAETGLLLTLSSLLRVGARIQSVKIETTVLLLYIGSSNYK